MSVNLGKDFSIISMKTLEIELIGASREESVGVLAKGLPIGFKVNIDELQNFMSRRAPSATAWSTARKESDIPRFLSGISTSGVINGEPFRADIKNEGASKDALCTRNRIPRPGHADFSAVAKYGSEVDLRGGGRFSGRMTAPLCIVGGILLQYLQSKGITVCSHIYSLAGISDRPFDSCAFAQESVCSPPSLPVLDALAGSLMQKKIAEAKADKDSVGGVAEIKVSGIPAGIGGELFERLDAVIARNIISVPSVKGIEFGAGFDCAEKRGSENNDEYYAVNGKVLTKTNNCGGILGGLSNGMPIIFRVAVKPTPSIEKKQNSVDLLTALPEEIEIKGNNDAAILPRVLPVLEAVTAFALYEELS